MKKLIQRGLVVTSVVVTLLICGSTSAFAREIIGRGGGCVAWDKDLGCTMMQGCIVYSDHTYGCAYIDAITMDTISFVEGKW